MSVVEFSADSWQASSPGLLRGLGDRIEALSELSEGLESLAASGNITGRGADGMRAYIREVHVPVIQSMVVGLLTFQTAVGVYWDGYSQVDSDGNFRLVNDEFDAHLSQLEAGMERVRGFGEELRAIAAGASHLVSLGGAGAGAADRAVADLERMHRIVKTQQQDWVAYEATDPGFGQVVSLIGEVRRIVTNLGSLTVGRGRDYVPGSFNATLQRLGEVTGPMMEYCQQNEQVAADGWDALFTGYIDDVEAEEKRKQQEDAGWGMLWDGLQILAGAVVTVVGVAFTPFTGGASLIVTGLGLALVSGGVNSYINHASIATTGQGLNLIGDASDQIGQWYDANITQPANASGDKGLALLAGVGGGIGNTISGALQTNVVEIAEGISTLATSEEARNQLWKQLADTGAKILGGDAYAAGQVVGSLIPLMPAATATKPLTVISAASRTATSALRHGAAKTGHQVKAALGDTRTALDHASNTLTQRLGTTERNIRDALASTLPTPQLAGGPRLHVGTPVTDAISALTRPGTTPTHPGRGGSSVDDLHVRDDFTPAPATPEAKPHPRGKREVTDPADPTQPGRLLPNVTYRASAPGTNHTYVYETNSRGLIDRVFVDFLHLKPAGRPRHKHDANTPDKLPGDEAGHLIADMFDGDPTLKNIVSQNWKTNRGKGSDWAKLERDWRRALEAKPPQKVTDITIKISYDTNRRPTGFEIHYKIDGEAAKADIDNPILER